MGNVVVEKLRFCRHRKSLWDAAIAAKTLALLSAGVLPPELYWWTFHRSFKPAFKRLFLINIQPPPSYLKAPGQRQILPEKQTLSDRYNGPRQPVSAHSPTSTPHVPSPFINRSRHPIDTSNSLEGRLLFAVPKSTSPSPPHNPTKPLRLKLPHRRPPATPNPRPPNRLGHPIPARNPPRHRPREKPSPGPNLPPRSRHPHLRRRRARRPRYHRR